MFLVAVFLFYIQSLIDVKFIHTDIEPFKWIFESSIIRDVASTLIVVPILYLTVESAADERFKTELREIENKFKTELREIEDKFRFDIRNQLHDFLADPVNVIPRIDPERLNGLLPLY
jgi:hypothetical protein